MRFQCGATLERNFRRAEYPKNPSKRISKSPNGTDEGVVTVAVKEEEDKERVVVEKVVEAEEGEEEVREARAGDVRWESDIETLEFGTPDSCPPES